MSNLPPITDDLQFCFRSDVGTYSNLASTTAAVTDNAPIATWQDQSDNANHLVQPSSGNRPTLKLAQINGLPSVRLNGTSQWFEFINAFVAAKFTAYAVVRIQDSAMRTIVCGDIASPEWRMDGQKQRMVSAGVADIGFGTSTLALNTWAQRNVSWDLSNAIFRASGAADGTISNPNTGYGAIRYVGVNGAGVFQNGVGQFNSFFNSDLACLVLYGAIHTTVQRQQIEAWVTSIFNV